MAGGAVQGQKGDHVGGTLPDRSAGSESGTEGILSTDLAPGRVTIGLGAPASRGWFDYLWDVAQG